MPCVNTRALTILCSPAAQELKENLRHCKINKFSNAFPVLSGTLYYLFQMNNTGRRPQQRHEALHFEKHCDPQKKNLIKKRFAIFKGLRVEKPFSQHFPNDNDLIIYLSFNLKNLFLYQLEKLIFTPLGLKQTQFVKLFFINFFYWLLSSRVHLLESMPNIVHFPILVNK